MKFTVQLITVSFLLLTPSFTKGAERVEHNGCYAEWSDKELVIGNALVERKWTIKQGLLSAVSLKDKASSTEWLRQAGRQPAPHPGGSLAAEERKLTFSSKKGKQNHILWHVK